MSHKQCIKNALHIKMFWYNSYTKHPLMFYQWSCTVTRCALS